MSGVSGGMDAGLDLRREERVRDARAGFEVLAELARKAAHDLAGATAEMASRVEETLRARGKVLFCGNGGSAAEAQHLAAEYVVRFSRERAPLAALALTTDASVLTAAANDHAFGSVFERQVRALGREGDLLVLLSTSGESENLLRAAAAARDGGVATVALLAKGGGRLADLVDLALIVPTDVTARAQEIHLAVGHVVCELVERAFVERP